MDRNKDIYCACLLMFSASEFLQRHEPEFSNMLLDKTKEYSDTIDVDEKLINEVKEYADQIEKSIDQFEGI